MATVGRVRWATRWTRWPRQAFSPERRGRSSVAPFEQFSACLRDGRVQEADGLLRQLMAHPTHGAAITAPLANTLISAWIRQNQLAPAWQVYDLLQAHTKAPNARTVTLLLNASLHQRSHLARLPALMAHLTHHVPPDHLLQLSGHAPPRAPLSPQQVDPRPCVKLPARVGRAMHAWERQLYRERSQLSEKVEEYLAWSQGVERVSSSRGGRGRESTSCLPPPSPGQALILRWFTSLRGAIEKEFQLLPTNPDWPDLQPLLSQSPARLALLTICEALRPVLASSQGAKFTQVILAVGQSLHTEMQHHRLAQALEAAPPGPVQVRVQAEAYQQVRREMEAEAAWSPRQTAKVGGWLVNLLIHSTTMNNGRTPPLRHGYHNYQGKRYGMVTAHPTLRAHQDLAHWIGLGYHAKHLPMVVPPLPWRGVRHGPYLLSAPSLVRGASPSHHRRLQQADLRLVREGLDILSSTPWRIHPHLYSIVEALHASSSSSSSSSLLSEEHTSILQAARALKDEPRLYFPHSMDFRGRCYPLPSVLHHMGSDLCRGLLQWSEGRPVGERGLWWMQVHLANLYGCGKIPYEERVAFALAHRPHILASARQPLGSHPHETWWQQAEHPWQTLAVCLELAEAWALDNPHEYVSYGPHHVDGSCNGLQHYAAIGGDEQGAHHVNLLPSTQPQDIYQEILRAVQHHIDTDAQRDHPAALALQGHVHRRTIKQTVMTYVYGVTPPGARRQIQQQVAQVEAIGESERAGVSEYLTQVTFQAMESAFTNARDIMQWLSTCARLLGRQGHPTAWTTPLGFPVEQPYRRSGKTTIQTSLQQLVLVSEEDDQFPVSVQRQRTAFPPNYVHSLDATHMLATARACHQRGMVFAAVHDSFWTHAGDMDALHGLLRESFVAIHQAPLLPYLLHGFQREHPSLPFPPPPSQGPLDLSLVRQSPYFFQ